MRKRVVLLGAVAVAAAPTAWASGLDPGPPDDPGVAGIAHCVVPAVRGLTPAVAKRRISSARCGLAGVSRQRSRVRRGRVATSVPKAGTILAQRTGVLLVLSSGRR